MNYAIKSSITLTILVVFFASIMVYSIITIVANAEIDVVRYQKIIRMGVKHPEIEEYSKALYQNDGEISMVEFYKITKHYNYLEKVEISKKLH